MKKSAQLALSLLSASLSAQVQLLPLDLTPIGKVAQFDLSEKAELILINQQGELWKVTETAQKLAEGISSEIEPKAQYGRIAAADKSGHFLLWTENKIYPSDIPLAKKATMTALPFATIAVSPQKGEFKLVRIETKAEKADITARSESAVLPDAHPIQIDFDSHNVAQGHIAVLAKPDSTTYQHAVLGDDIEAAEIQYLERHNLKPLAEKLSHQGLVFEANRLESLIQPHNTKLISVMSGDGNGAKTVVIGKKNGKLVVESESEPLPTNRWQSPFSFNGKLYAVQMPHLKGNLVEFHQTAGQLEAKLLTAGLSNHRYGDVETNLAAVTENFALIPKAGYRNVAILDKTGALSELSTELPAEIKQTKATASSVYVLLKNGEMWIARHNFAD